MLPELPAFAVGWRFSRAYLHLYLYFEARISPIFWALCVPGDNSGVMIGVIRGGRMPVPKMCRVLYQFYFVARVRNVYVLHYDDQQTLCGLCRCMSVLYGSVQKSP